MYFPRVAYCVIGPKLRARLICSLFTGYFATSPLARSRLRAALFNLSPLLFNLNFGAFRFTAVFRSIMSSEQKAATAAAAAAGKKEVSKCLRARVEGNLFSP